MRPFLLSAAAVVLAAAAGRAADPKLVTKVFEVADLVTPIPNFVVPEFAAGAQPAGRPRTPSPAERFRNPTAGERADELVRLLTGLVRPFSWQANGGAGVVEYFDLGSALVVKNTPEAVAEVEEVIKALRRLQDVSIATELRLVSVPAGFAAEHGLKPGAVLDDDAVRKALEAAQGHAHCNVMQAPKLTTFNGQVATVSVVDQKVFVTGVEAVPVKGQVVCVPQNKAVALGDTITLCGRLTPDLKGVNLRVHVARTRLADATVPMLPVTTMITPVFEGGSQGKPVPFTQFVQAPKLHTDAAERAACVPDGGTLVVGGWTEPGGRVEAGVPVLSRIPYVSRLFKTQGIGPDMEVVVLATARVINNAEPEVSVAPMPREKEPAGPVEVKLVMADVSADFIRSAGLDPKADAWCAGSEAVNLALRADTRRDILSAPTLCVQSGQTGSARVGADGQAGPRLAATVTPAVSADKKFVRLRVETEVTAPGTAARAVEATIVVPAGRTVVVRGAKRETADGPIETLFFVTPRPVAPPK